MATNTINDLKAANPYRNQPYKESGWQKFLSSLGFRTQADAWKENMSVQAAEYDAALAQKEFDTNYNDPQSQVARMKAAGLNPDIDPSSIDSGSAAPMGEDPSTPMQATGDEGNIISVAQTAANMILSGFSSAFGLVTNIQGIHRNSLQNDILSLQGEEGINNMAQSIWQNFLPTAPQDETMINPFDWKAQALKNAESFSRRRLPRKFRQKFVDTVQSYWESAPGESAAYKTWLDRVRNRKGYYQDSQEFYSDIDDVLAIISEPLAKMSEKIFTQAQKTDLAELESGEAQAKDNEEYYNSLDSSLQGQSENAANQLSKTNNEMAETLNASLNKIVSGLEEKSKEGGIAGAISQFALVTIASVRLWLANVGMPSVSRSSSQSSSQSYGKNSTTIKNAHSDRTSINW